MSIRNIFCALVIGFSVNAYAMETTNTTITNDTSDVSSIVESITTTDFIETSR